jgi:hypothetical protein
MRGNVTGKLVVLECRDTAIPAAGKRPVSRVKLQNFFQQFTHF